jgi:uncharacterized protein YggE
MSLPLRIAVPVVLLGLLLGSASPAAPDAAATGQKLTVSGSATVFADPDAAVLTFAVTTSDAKGKAARASAEKRVGNIKEGIAGLGFKNVTVEVVPVPLSLVVAGPPNPDGSQQVQSVQARSLFYVTVREGNKDRLREMVRQIADVAVENGGVSPSDGSSLRTRFAGGFGRGATTDTVPGPQVEWRCENDQQPRQKAIRKAVDDALASARTVADRSPVKVLEVEVGGGVADRLDVLRSRLLDTPSNPAHVPISVTVKVICSY